MADRITVIGNIAQAPRRRTTTRGDVVEFTLARNQRVQAADGAWQDGETLWYRVAAWDRLADSAESALLRGQRVIVQGSLNERRWTGDDGVERLSRDLRADAIGRDISQRPGGAARPTAPPAALAVTSPPVQAEPSGDQQQAAVDPGAPSRQEPLEPAPAGWSTACAAEEETPF